MKRRIAAAILVTLLPLGIAACGSQSKADACKLLEKPLNDASVALVSSAKAGDAGSVADTYTKFASAYEEAGKKITNKDVKAAAVAAGDSAQALADFAKTVGDEPSAEQMTEAMDRYTTFTTSMSSLETVCNAR